MIDFKYDIRTGKIHLLDTSNLDSYIFSILKSGFDLGDNTIYLRPTYIDLDGNPLKKSGTITFGSSEDTNLYRSDANVLKTDDNFDALALRIGGTEVLSSNRIFHNFIFDLRYKAGNFVLYNFEPNALYLAHLRGYSVSWNDTTGLTGTNSIWYPDMTDHYMSIDLSTAADPLILTVTGSMPVTTDVGSIRLVVIWHGGKGYNNIKFEVQRNDDVWVEVPVDFDIGYMQVSERLHNYAPYPTYTPWKGFRITFSNKVATSGYWYLYGIIYYAPRAPYPYYVRKTGDTIFGTMSTQTIQPRTDNAYDLGSASYRWRNLELAGYGNLGSLRIGGTEVITSGRVLQNVSADASIITSGVFDVARIPNLDASKITSGVLDLARIPSIDWTRMPFDTWSELLSEIGNNVGDYLNLTYLQIDSTTVITNSRVLQNIIQVAQDWIPDGNSTRNLGSTSNQWHRLYLGGELIFGGDTNLYRSGSNILKTDDHFDSLSLKIGGTEVISSSRVLRNISNVDQSLLPLTGSSYNLGSSDLKWNAVYANNFYGTAHYADVCFQDLICPICNKHFKVNDKLVLLVTKVSEKEIRCVPAHLECA
mgnify:CR=1 FL=1